jgi:hypothetical protein
MSLVEQFNIGSRVQVRTSLGNTAVTQTSNTAAAASTGEAVDRNDSSLRRYYSCAAVVTGMFLAGSSARTGLVTMNFQHSSDGTSWDSFSTATVPVATGRVGIWGATSSGYASLSTAGTEQNSLKQSVNLNGARRYIRIQVPTATFSDCSSGQVLNVQGVIVFGGADELPALG